MSAKVWVFSTHFSLTFLVSALERFDVQMQLHEGGELLRYCEEAKKYIHLNARNLVPSKTRDLDKFGVRTLD